MLPLQGMKIVELGHYIAAPFCTRLLADLGAEVIKVEPPGGDPFRGWGSQKDGHSVWFSVHGRNKLSVTVDLKSEEGKRRVKALCARADAMVENFVPATWSGSASAPSVLHAENPGLVITRISGYGQDGPYRDKPAFGAIGEAMGGLRHLTANPGVTDHPPPRCGVSISDDLAGMYAALALVSACWGRDRNGQPGRMLDLDLVSSVFSLTEGMLPEHGLFGWVRSPLVLRFQRPRPTNTYLCADGKWLCIAGNSDLIFRRLMEMIGRPELAADPRMATNGGRCAHASSSMPPSAHGRRRCRPSLPKPRSTLRRCRAHASMTSPTAPTDPHFRAREMVMQVQDPLLGPVLHPAPPFRFDGVAPADMVRWTGRAAGADNDHVFHEILGEAR
jgi:crotonobetainyl-CoA:carnitine CoA-transferase CaiB-like acyl-CoA transferase